MMEIENPFIEVCRNLDGKGRLALPGDLREAAGFSPAEPISIRLAVIDGNAAFIITSRNRPPEAENEK